MSLVTVTPSGHCMAVPVPGGDDVQSGHCQWQWHTITLAITTVKTTANMHTVMAMFTTIETMAVPPIIYLRTSTVIISARSTRSSYVHKYSNQTMGRTHGQASAIGTGASYSYDRSLLNDVRHHHLHGFVELRSLLLKSSPDDQTCQSRTPHKFDFEDADKEPLQQFDVTVGWDVGDLRPQNSQPTKFSNASSPPFFSVSQSAETTRIYYVGFLGQWSERKQEPVITVYESQANIADHERILGTEGNFSLPSH
ncbi:hypothetical protein EDB83DRAFT_2314742 [Lactarius deliciosus]|nr:hypothetical protein EDB83DRAFT_2314742 [Lactarius deliciosus]